MKNIAVLVSGSGTNMENIARYFKDSELLRIALVISDNEQAPALDKAKRLGIEAMWIPKRGIREMGKLVELFTQRNIDYIVLAGFLSLIPADVIWLNQGRIINIHPALLPKYGGKGMYGMKVHEAVIAAGEKQSGITIHHVNERYDDGAVIAQFKVDVEPEDTPQTLADKIHKLEYEHYPKVIEREVSRLQ